jgi:hypothetical protein
MGTNKGIVLALLWLPLGMSSAVATAVEPVEPSYLIYPSSAAVFRFDSARYQVLTPPDPRFQSDYSVGGQMLWDRVENRVAFEVYRAPDLIGFEPSPGAGSEFVTFRNSFEVVVDGFGSAPRTLGSLCLRFWPEPASAVVQIEVDAFPLQRWTTQLPSLDVVTPVATGFYSDTRAVVCSWTGASVMRVIAFSDKNGDGAFQGTPRFGILALNAVVPVAPTTWGRVKSLYR